MSVVVIDASIIYSDPRLRRAHFRLVRQHAADGSFELVVPEVVVREAIAKLRQRAEAAYLKMASPGEDLARLGLPTGIPDTQTQAEHVEAYERELRRPATRGGAASRRYLIHHTM